MLTCEQKKKLILQLIDIAWSKGAIRSPKDASAIEELRQETIEMKPVHEGEK